jgi:hypothetical protein
VHFLTGHEVQRKTYSLQINFLQSSVFGHQLAQQSPHAGSCEYGNEPSDSTENTDYLITWVTMNSLHGGSVKRLYIQKITQRDSNPRSSVQSYSTNAVSKISRFVSHFLFRNYLRGPLVTNDVECTSDERAKCWWRSLCWREVTMRIHITVFLNTISVTPSSHPRAVFVHVTSGR